MKKTVLAALFLILTAGKVFAAAHQEPIMVFAAASLKDALKEIAADFQKEDGTRVQFNFGGSKTLRIQIEKGMPCDVFIAADKESTEKLLSQGLLEKNLLISLLENKLIIVSAKDSEEKLDSLFDMRFNQGDALAIADPKIAPAGVYARQAFTKAGLWDKFKGHIVPLLDVRAAMAQVQAGNAKYAVVYATDAHAAANVKVVYHIPAQLYDRIIYTAAVVKKGENSPAARNFLSFLQSRRSKMIFQKYGFQPYEH